MSEAVAYYLDENGIQQQARIDAPGENSKLPFLKGFKHRTPQGKILELSLLHEDRNAELFRRGELVIPIEPGTKALFTAIHLEIDHTPHSTSIPLPASHV